MDFYLLGKPKNTKNPFFTKINTNKQKKCSFDEIPKSQMPEGTLNRTFCLSKIIFSSFFCLLGIFWSKNCNCLAFLTFFDHFYPKNIPKPNFIEIFEKIHPKHDFIGIFLKKNFQKHDFISFFYRLPPKSDFIGIFLKNMYKNTFF